MPHSSERDPCMNERYNFKVNGIVFPVVVGSNLQFDVGWRASIDKQPETFIPKCMKVKMLETGEAFEAGLEDFNGPGVYLVQERFILKRLSRGAVTEIQKVAFDLKNENSYLQNPKLITLIKESNCGDFHDRGSILVAFKYESAASFHYASFLSVRSLLCTTQQECSLTYVVDPSNKFKIPRSSFEESSDETLELVDDASNSHQFMSYMLFKIDSLPVQSKGPSHTHLEESFKHSLTVSGVSTLATLKSVISRRSKFKYETSFNLYKIVPLFQSSGSGKTKMCTELVWETPGFYIVLRPSSDRVAAYPLANNVSDELMNIYRSSSSTREPLIDLRGTDYSISKTGHCLHLIAKIVVTYFDKIVHIVAHHPNSLALVSMEEKVSYSLRTVRSEVESSFDLCSDEKMLQLYRKFLGKPTDCITVAQVSAFIEDLLGKLEAGFLLSASTTESAESNLPSIRDAVVLELKKRLADYPFVLVLDEAPYLAHSDFDYQDPIAKSKYSGLQLFYRALGYLSQATNFVVLTLGTKITLQDLNPDKITSSRTSAATFVLPPIVFSGNSDIHTEEVSKVFFNPTYSSLQNPLTFKELTCYGHAIWSSVPFAMVKDFAISKLKNGDLSGYNMIPALWMVRLGMHAAPETSFASDLVSNRMATCFEVDYRLNKYKVFYPSDPCLAMAARHLTDTTNYNIEPDSNRGLFDSSTTELLFDGLNKMKGFVKIDKGEFAEYLAGMATLKAIDNVKSPPIKNCDKTTYDSLLSEMQRECGQLSHVWSAKTHLLEDREVDRAERVLSFPDYHVVTVKQFLLECFGPEIGNQLDKFPSVMLEGLMNASHLVKLDRNLEIDYRSKFELGLPAAGELLSTDHNIIDRALLCYGLRRQCGFYLPFRYPAFDYIFPVCLNKVDSHGRPLYSMLGIQVKAKKDAEKEKIEAMNMRYHYVKCPRSNDHQHSPETCTYCEDETALEDVVFANQISIVLSLDAEPKLRKGNKTINRSGLQLAPDEVAKRIFVGRRTPFDTLTDDFEFEVHKPLPAPAATYIDVARIDGNLDVMVSAWDKEEDDLRRKKVAKTVPIFSSAATGTSGDRLYTIIWRGMSLFERLFKHKDSAANARAILEGDNIRSQEKHLDFDRYLLALLRDGKHNVPAYNEVLQSWRGSEMSTSPERFAALHDEYERDFQSVFDVK